MRKYLIFILISFSGMTIVFSQNNKEAVRADSLYIDSMIRKLPVTKDTARINFLNKLANAILRTRYSQKYRTDWASPYIETAYKEAKQLDYKTGITEALMNSCSMYMHLFIHNTRVKNDNVLVVRNYEAAVNELLEIAHKINDPEILGNAYGQQAGFYMWTNKKTEQIKAQIISINWYKKAPPDESRECEDNLNLSYTYLDLGEFEKAFEYSNRALELAKKLVQKNDREADEVTLQLSYMNVSKLYETAGDYETALKLLYESRQFHLNGKSKVTWGMEGEIGELYLESGQYDFALHYLKPLIKNRKFSYSWPQVAKAYLKLNNIDSALKYYNLSIDSMENRGTVAAVITGLRRSYFGKASILNQQKKFNEALKLARKSLAMELKRTNKLELVDTYELMSQVFYKLGKNDSAYLYLLKHNELKNSLLTRQFLWRLKNYKNEAEEAKKEARLGFLDRDNKLKEQQLKQEASLKKFLIAGLILLLIAGVFIFRYIASKRKNEKLETEKKHAKLQQRATELEMQALRAQMNPHFIFNCLSSINKFILKNDTGAASDYLTRFSRLIRFGLNNSQLSLIPLSDEIEMLRLYLDMERLRFSEAFGYNIIYENTIEPETIYIPPMLLQPFCENAIWHGLMHKEGPGKLDITMSIQNGELQCTIEDNGIGREKAAELKSTLRQAQGDKKHKSFGLRITTERLALFNNEKTTQNFYKTDDVLDASGNVAGTKVTLNIKYRNTTLQPVKELHGQ
jgi:tetratricopeptide (TPR) repeat protein